MELTAPLINAGFAVSLAAAGVIAAPVVAPLPGLPDMQTRDVQLVDVTWDQVLQTALANATDIYDHFSPAPFADLQQFAANLPDYLDGTRNFDTDLTTAYNAAITPFIRPPAPNRTSTPRSIRHRARSTSAPWASTFSTYLCRAKTVS